MAGMPRSVVRSSAQRSRPFVRRKSAQPVQIRIGETVQVKPRHLNAVVPPQCNAVPLHQLEEALEYSLLQRVACCTAVGTANAIVVLTLLVQVVEVTEAHRKVADDLVRQRPDGCPL